MKLQKYVQCEKGELYSNLLLWSTWICMLVVKLRILLEVHCPTCFQQD